MSSTLSQPALSAVPSVIGRLVRTLSMLAARTLDRGRTRRDMRRTADAAVIPGV